jgi:hypothetical protein
VFGHTHKPWVHEYGGVLFVNCGFVGKPRTAIHAERSRSYDLGPITPRLAVEMLGSRRYALALNAPAPAGTRLAITRRRSLVR